MEDVYAVVLRLRREGCEVPAEVAHRDSGLPGPSVLPRRTSAPSDGPRAALGRPGTADCTPCSAAAYLQSRRRDVPASASHSSAKAGRGGRRTRFPPVLHFVHDTRIALHEDLWAQPRAIGDGLGRAARMGGEEPARHLQGADHRRGCAQFADDRLPVPAVAVLPGDRWRRRA